MRAVTHSASIPSAIAWLTSNLNFSNMAATGAASLLSRQLKQMQSDKDIPGISCGLVDNNIFEWEVMLMISDDCRFYGGTRGPLKGKYKC
jgi:hypothetical protein